MGRSPEVRRRISEGLRAAYASGRRGETYRRAQEARRRPVMVNGEFFSSVREAETWLGIGRSTFYRRARRGELEVVYL